MLDKFLCVLLLQKSSSQKDAKSYLRIFPVLRSSITSHFMGIHIRMLAEKTNNAITFLAQIVYCVGMILNREIKDSEK